jgi:hypothetical protein
VKGSTQGATHRERGIKMKKYMIQFVEVPGKIETCVRTEIRSYSSEPMARKSADRMFDIMYRKGINVRGYRVTPLE